MKNLVTIATYDNPVTANIYKAKLQDMEIPCLLKDETTISLNWMLSNAIGGIKLQVFEPDVEVAQQIILEDESEEAELGMNQDEITGGDANLFSEEGCPRCGSDNFSETTRSDWIIALSWLCLGFPLPAFMKKAHCYSCHHKWRRKKV